MGAPQGGGSNSIGLKIVAGVVAAIVAGVAVWWFTKSDEEVSRPDVEISIPSTGGSGGGTESSENGGVIDIGSGGFPEEVRQNFLTSCGGSSDGNVAYCECVLRELEAQFTIEEFFALEEEYAGTGELPAAMMDIVQLCA